MFSLNNSTFWKWMDLQSTGDSYWHMFESLVKNYDGVAPDYIIEEQIKHQSETSEIMRNLSLVMPKEYFAEMQYCVMAYAISFSWIFPQIANKVDQLAYIEWLLYMESQNTSYRDHFVHMFKVAFSGCRVLCENQKFIKELADMQFSSGHFMDWANKQGLSLDTCNDVRKIQIVKRAFLLSAIFHDIGYGSYFLSEYKKRLHNLCLPGRDSADLSECSKDILLNSLAANYVKNSHLWLKENNDHHSTDREEVIIGFFRDCYQMNHSIASCLCLLEIVDNLRHSRALSLDMYLSFQIAAEAIMLHDMTNKEKKWAHLAKITDHFLAPSVHKQIPVAIILILADELSIFNRNKIIGTPQSKQVIFAYDFDWNKHVPESIEVAVEKQKVTITSKTDESNKLVEALCSLSVFQHAKSKYKFFNYNLYLH